MDTVRVRQMSEDISSNLVAISDENIRVYDRAHQAIVLLSFSLLLTAGSEIASGSLQDLLAMSSLATTLLSQERVIEGAFIARRVRKALTRNTDVLENR